MRQPGLGKVEWIEEEKRKKQHAAKISAKKGEKEPKEKKREGKK